MNFALNSPKNSSDLNIPTIVSTEKATPTREEKKNKYIYETSQQKHKIFELKRKYIFKSQSMLSKNA